MYLKSFKFFSSILPFFFLLLLNQLQAQEAFRLKKDTTGKIYTLSNKFLQRNEEAFFQKDNDECDPLDKLKCTISKFGGNLPNYYSLYNRDKVLTVDQLFQNTLTQGLPTFGSANSPLNLEIKSMLAATLTALDRMSNVKSANEIFKTLVTGFQNCQQVQYRTIAESYQKVRAKGSLDMKLVTLINDLKIQWMLETMHSLENHKKIEPHLESSYIKTINKKYPIRGHAQASLDTLATHQLNNVKILTQFEQMMNASDFFIGAHNGFIKTENYNEDADLLKALEEIGANLSEVYNEDGKINEIGTLQLLIAKGILVEATPSIKNVKIIDLSSEDEKKEDHSSVQNPSSAKAQKKWHISFKPLLRIFRSKK